MESMDLFSDRTEQTNALVCSQVSSSGINPGSGHSVPGDSISPPARITRPIPSEDLLLKVDRSYRQKAAHDTLPKIAPKYLNHSGIAWLPIMRVSYGKWRFTARFSNSLRANQMGKTSEWVIINYESNDNTRGQVTVVNEKLDSSATKRLVRGLANEPVHCAT